MTNILRLQPNTLSYGDFNFDSVVNYKPRVYEVSKLFGLKRSKVLSSDTAMLCIV